MTTPTVLKKLNQRNIILASQSPRRQQLLADLGLEFEVRVIPDIDESFPDNMAPKKVPVYLAQQKSKAYKSALKPEDILITADTIVATEHEILGKPANRTEAFDMIKSLCERDHMVVTGVNICDTEKEISFKSVTIVHFGALSDEEINYYIEKFQPFDKAGSYGIQEWIGYIGVEHIEGSYFNVMGLPVQHVYSALKNF